MLRKCATLVIDLATSSTARLKSTSNGCRPCGARPATTTLSAEAIANGRARITCSQKGRTGRGKGRVMSQVRTDSAPIVTRMGSIRVSQRVSGSPTFRRLAHFRIENKLVSRYREDVRGATRRNLQLPIEEGFARRGELEPRFVLVQARCVPFQPRCVPAQPGCAPAQPGCVLAQPGCVPIQLAWNFLEHR